MAERGPREQAAARNPLVVGCAWTLVGMVIVFALPPVVASVLWDALWRHAERVESWGAALFWIHVAVPLGGLLSSALRTIDRTGVAPVPRVGRASRVVAIATGVVASALFVIDFALLGGVPDHVALLADIATARVLQGVGAAIALTLAAIVATAAVPAAVSAARLARNPALVTGVAQVGEGAGHSVRVVHRPGVFGGPVSEVVVNDQVVSTICPGQAVGLVGDGSRWNVKVAARSPLDQVRARAAVATLTLTPGISTTVIVTGRATRKPRIRSHAGEVQFEATKRPFTGRFASLSVPASRASGPAARVRHVEGGGTVAAAGVVQAAAWAPSQSVAGAPAADPVGRSRASRVFAAIAWGAVASFSGSAVGVLLAAAFAGGEPVDPDSILPFALWMASLVWWNIGLGWEGKRFRLSTPFLEAPSGTLMLALAGAFSGAAVSSWSGPSGTGELVGAAVGATAMLVLAPLLMIRALFSGKHPLVHGGAGLRAWRRNPTEVSRLSGARDAGAALRFLSTFGPDEMAVSIDGGGRIAIDENDAPAVWIRPGTHEVRIESRLHEVAPALVRVDAVKGHTTTVLVGLTPPRLLWLLPRTRRALARALPPSPGLPD